MKQTPPNNRQDLLDELDHLRGLLGDEARDVNLDELPLLDDGVGDDGQIPLLQPMSAPKPAAPQPAPTKPAAPTPAVAAPASRPAPQAAATPAPKPVHQATPAPAHQPTHPTTHKPASQPTPTAPIAQSLFGDRGNPFLKNAEDAIAARKADAALHARPTTDNGTTKNAPLLSEPQINRLVDEVLKECLPHIEQTLRIHLTAALHRQNRNN